MLVGCGQPSAEPRASAAAEHASAGVNALREKKLETDVITIDRIYASMDGPSSTYRFALEEETPGSLLWLTAVRNQAIAAGSGEELSQEFLCHSNLSLTQPEQLARISDKFTATENLESSP